MYSITEIICGFPAVGKTYLFNHQKELGLKILDSDSSQFSWIKDKNGNNTKERNPEFPNNYIQHIKNNIGKVDIILTSTHAEVLDALYNNNFNPLIVYPSVELKEDYIERYKQRGNNKSFIKFLSENWDNFINNIENDYRFRGYKLKKGQYLKDINLKDYKELYTHFVFQNDNMNNNVKKENITTCHICHRPISNYSNYITTNKYDICIHCVYDLYRCLPNINVEK